MGRILVADDHDSLRRGIARAMMEAMLEWGRELGCGEYWVGTETDNGPARALYRGFGPPEQEAIIYEGDL